MVTVALVTSDYRGEVNGLARYDAALYRGLQAETDIQVTLCPVRRPKQPLWEVLRWATGLDVAAFLRVYPVRLPRTPGAIMHLTTTSHALGLGPWRHGPVVVTVHDIIHHTHRGDPRMSTYRHGVQRMADARSLRNLHYADLILASSDFTKSQLIHELGLAGEKIRVVRLGVDHQRFRPQKVPYAFYHKYGLHPQTPYVLHISTEEPRKNIETLLHAWQYVRRAVPEAVLLKAGRCLYPEERKGLLRLVSQLRLGNQVHFLGDVDDEDLPTLYNAARIFAFPSLAEGFGLPVLEAMACGTPVVCSTAPALTELVAGVALQHEPTDAATLADHLIYLLRTPEAHRFRAMTGVARAAQFSWAQTVRETAQSYRALHHRLPQPSGPLSVPEG